MVLNTKQRGIDREPRTRANHRETEPNKNRSGSVQLVLQLLTRRPCLAYLLRRKCMLDLNNQEVREAMELAEIVSDLMSLEDIELLLASDEEIEIYAEGIK